jgi:hypothetical protein
LPTHVPQPGAAVRPAAGEAQTAEPEQVLYHGGVSLWLGWRAIASGVLAALAGLLFWLWGVFQPQGGWGRFAGVRLGLPLFLAATIMLVYVYLALRAVRCRITTHLIERERGILSKRVDSLDLARVTDVQLVQSLADRMLQTGTIEVYCSDQRDPVLRLEALPGARFVYEKLRDAVLRISRRRGMAPSER